MSRRDFYEHKYLQEYASDQRPLYVGRGLIARLYLALRRFETSRGDIVLEILPPKIERMLDIGCGDGILAMRAKARSHLVFGVDLSLNRLKHGAMARTRSHNGSGVFFAVADADSYLPFPDDYFDVVTCVAVFEHVFDPCAVIIELHRVLQPNGCLILQVPNIAWLPHRIGLLCGKLPRTSYAPGWDGGHLHYFTLKSLCQLLEDCGFRVIQKTGCGIFARWRNWWPSLLTGDLIVKGIKL